MKCWYYLSVKIWNQRENAFEFFNIFFYRFISTRFRDYARSTCRLSPNNENCKKTLFQNLCATFQINEYYFFRTAQNIQVITLVSSINILDIPIFHRVFGQPRTGFQNHPIYLKEFFPSKTISLKAYPIIIFLNFLGRTRQKPFLQVL